jgi:hypothetical protein
VAYVSLSLLNFDQGYASYNLIGPGRESLVKGKNQYDWPPCIYKFRPTAFYSENIVFTKQPILMEKQTYFAFPAIWVPLTWPKPVLKTKDH